MRANAEHRRYVAAGELLAVDAHYLAQDERGAYVMLYGAGGVCCQYVGDTAVITVRGALEYHSTWWGASYDGILSATAMALAGEFDGDETIRLPSNRIILKLDSCGGVVAGAWASVREFRRITADVSTLCYVDELAASAGCAWACACDEIVIPDSGNIGSVGVIATMVSVSEMNTKAGIRYELITSGSHKADGHPAIPTSDGARSEERSRVNLVAAQFYDLVAETRGIRASVVRDYQARIFTGARAVAAKLADKVMTWPDLMRTVVTEQSRNRPKSVASSSAGKVARSR